MKTRWFCHLSASRAQRGRSHLRPKSTRGSPRVDPKHEPVGSRVCGFVPFGYAVSYVSVLPLHMCNWMCLFQLGKVVIDFKQALLQIMENYEK